MSEKSGVVPPLLYIMLIAPYVNGMILPGFNNAEIYPGEPVQVRGESGLKFDHAAKLVSTNKWVWCDRNSAHVEEEPLATEEEIETLAHTGATLLAGDGNFYPEFHRDDPDYTGPVETAPIIGVTDVSDFGTTSPTMAPLTVIRTRNERRTIAGQVSGTILPGGAVSALDAEG